MFKSSKKAGVDSTLSVQQLSIQAGKRQETPANLWVVDAASRRERKNRGTLYLVIEALEDGSLPRELCDELCATISGTYYGLTGSITRALREALLAANALLFEKNLRVDSEHRLLAGFNCAVVRDTDVYVAQLGPALVAYLHQDGLVRYPASSVWLENEKPGIFDLNRQPPAGLRRDAEPDLYHTVLDVSDVLVLSTTALCRFVSDEDLIQAIIHRATGSARQALEDLAGGRDVSALIIERAAQIEEEEFEVQPETAPSAKRTFVQEPEAAEETVAKESVAETLGDLPLSEPPPPVVEMPPAEEMDQLPDEEAYKAEYEAPPPEERQPLIEMDQVRDGLSKGAKKLREGTETLLERVLPNALPEHPPLVDESRPAISLSGRALVGIALIIPLVMLFLIVMTRVQYQRIQGEQFDTLQTLAGSRYDQAIQREDVEYMRQGLYDALATVEEGLAIAPDDKDLGNLRRRIYHKLDEIDIVEPLYHSWKLIDLADEGLSAIASARIIIHDITVYVLNRGSDRVYKFLLNDVGDALQSVDPNSTLVQKGELLGGMRLGDMVDIAWMESGGSRTMSAFVILDRTGSLLSYDPQQGIDVLPIADSDIWLKPQAIGGYFGNLYLLDPLLGRILKYVPSDNAYTNPPSDYLKPQLDVDLTGAVDMTIDGHVYVLFADGHILKFLNGEQRPFIMRGLPSPMRNPTTIFCSGAQEPDAEGYLYVTDSGNQRIIQFDKEGNYVRQFRDKPGESRLEALRGVYVREETGRMFILSDKTLWLTKLPPLRGGQGAQ
jgi:hypothetical protein